MQYATPEKMASVNHNNIRLIEKYFNFKNINLSDASKKGYQSDFNQWLVYIMENYSNQEILKMVTDDMDEMVDLLEDFIAFCTSVLGNNERRVQRRMSSISSFFLYLRKKRKIKENPIEFLDRPKIGKGEKPQIKQTFLSLEQVQTIRQGLKETGDTQLQLYFEFSLSTMARVNAVSNVKVEQIDFKAKRVNDVLEKEGYMVTLFPSSYAMELIDKWLRERKEAGIESDYLFITKYGGKWDVVKKVTIQTHWIKKIGKIVNVPELHAHDLRHTGSDILHKKGLPLETVSKLLHHKSTQTTLDHYLQTDFDKIQDDKSKFEI